MSSFDDMYTRVVEGRLTSIATTVALTLSTPTASADRPVEVRREAPDTVARVIFAETGPMSSPAERLAVASVIKNRIGHPGFDRGRLRSMAAVVKQPGQFESLGDKKNSTWMRSAAPSNLKGADAAAWKQSSLLASGRFTPVDDEIVYFHDRSIRKPKSWDNKFWETYEVLRTKNFVFYGVRER